MIMYVINHEYHHWWREKGREKSDWLSGTWSVEEAFEVDDEDLDDDDGGRGSSWSKLLELIVDIDLLISFVLFP